jgi:hypothetical protein
MTVSRQSVSAQASEKRKIPSPPFYKRGTIPFFIKKHLHTAYTYGIKYQKVRHVIDCSLVLRIVHCINL